MATVCVYYSCLRTRSEYPGLIMHRVPTKHPEITEKWVINSGNIKLLDLEPAQLRNRYVCSFHFTTDQYMDPLVKKRLMPYAVPRPYDQDDRHHQDDRDNREDSPPSSPIVEKPIITYGRKSSNEKPTVKIVPAPQINSPIKRDFVYAMMQDDRDKRDNQEDSRPPSPIAEKSIITYSCKNSNEKPTVKIVPAPQINPLIKCKFVYAITQDDRDNREDSRLRSPIVEKPIITYSRKSSNEKPTVKIVPTPQLNPPIERDFVDAISQDDRDKRDNREDSRPPSPIIEKLIITYSRKNSNEKSAVKIVPAPQINPPIKRNFVDAISAMPNPMKKRKISRLDKLSTEDLKNIIQKQKAIIKANQSQITRMKKTISTLKVKSNIENVISRYDFPSSDSKIIAQMQFKNKQTTWTTEEQNFSSLFYSQSPRVYSFLRNRNVILPGPSTIRKWSPSSIKAEPL